MTERILILPYGEKMPMVGLSTWQMNDPLELRNAMQAAFESGYRHFDTALAYRNEKIVGKVIARWIKRFMVTRDELFITTKLPMEAIYSDRIDLFLDKSLQNLGLSYVDLYLIQFPVYSENVKNEHFLNDADGESKRDQTDIIKLWKRLEDQVDAGKTKAIGLSNCNKEQLSEILRDAIIKPANAQIEIHVYLQNKELVKFCKDEGISVVAYSSLGSPRTRKLLMDSAHLSENIPQLMSDETVLSIAKNHSKTAAQILLRFLVQKGVGVIPKSANPLRIKENVDIFDFVLDKIEMHKLDALDGECCIIT